MIGCLIALLTLASSGNSSHHFPFKALQQVLAPVYVTFCSVQLSNKLIGELKLGGTDKLEK